LQAAADRCPAVGAAGQHKLKAAVGDGRPTRQAGDILLAAGDLALMAVPPKATVSRPLPLTVVLLALPPDSTSAAPPLTVALIAVRFDFTSSSPPLTTVALAAPPDELAIVLAGRLPKP
jgi:hypothetical protein